MSEIGELIDGIREVCDDQDTELLHLCDLAEAQEKELERLRGLLLSWRHAKGAADDRRQIDRLWDEALRLADDKQVKP